MEGGERSNACNKKFDDAQPRLHCRSKPLYNFMRKVKGVLEPLFFVTKSAPVEEQKNLSAKEYRSSEAHAQHLKSENHAEASQESGPPTERITIVKPLKGHVSSKPSSSSNSRVLREKESSDSEDEWVLVELDNDFDVVSESLINLHVNAGTSGSSVDQNEDIDEDEELLDALCCFICDLKHDMIESCMAHMYEQHGFLIPHVADLKDPKGLLTYLGLKVKMDFMCLYCKDSCRPFQSLEAVRKHMIAKGHCNLRYGPHLKEFYDYIIRDTDEDGKDSSGLIDKYLDDELRCGSKVRSRPKPRRSPARKVARAKSFASWYQSMGIATVSQRDRIVTMRALRQMNRNGVEAMRSKIGMKSNIIRKLPRNVPY